MKAGLCLFKKTLLHQQYSNQVPGLISAPGYFCLAPASLSEISLRRGPEVSKVRCSFGLLSLFALGPETPSGLLCSAKVMPKPLNAPENVNPECTFQLYSGFSVTPLFIWDAKSCDLLYRRVAEVAREHRWHPPKSLDLDENFKPEHTLFCRELRFVAIYALFLEIFGHKKCLFG